MKKVLRIFFILVLIATLSAVLIPTQAAAEEEGPTETKLLASDGAEWDRFGESVDIDGDTVVVGTYVNSSRSDSPDAAYVFTRSGDGWTEQAKLTAADGEAGDKFGYSVAISGDTVAVGAACDDDSASNAGSVYVFTRSGNTWNEQSKLLASDGDVWDTFGNSVSVDGDYIAIGANNARVNGSWSGAAYVFTRSGDAWSQQAKLTANDGVTHGDSFGRSIAIDGDTVAVGAACDDDSASNAGSVYVFTRSGNTWNEQSKLLASDGDVWDTFGNSVSVDGDTVVAGAYNDDDDGSLSGSAYVFVRDGGNWTQQAKLTASDGMAYDQFGDSVAASGDTIYIGNRGDDDRGAASGSVYIYTRSGDTWNEQSKLLASDGKKSGIFGCSVAVSGDAIAVGAYGDSDNGPYSGAAYVYEFTPPVLPPQELKQGAVEQLEQIALEADVKAERHINRAIRFINKSLEDKLWLDETHLDARKGWRVFTWEKAAVRKLERAKCKDASIAEAVDEVIASLIQADDALATLAIEEAAAGEVQNPRHQQRYDRLMAKAESKLEKARLLAEEGKPVRAIRNYRRAWKYAQRAARLTG